MRSTGPGRKKINRQQVMNLFRLHFVEQASNVIFVGGVGLGKSHLAIAPGLRACEERYSVLFASAIDIVNTLAAAQAADRLKQGLNRYIKPRARPRRTRMPTHRQNRRRPPVPDHKTSDTSAARRHHHQPRLPKMAASLQQRCHPDFRRTRPAAPLCGNSRHRRQQLPDERRKP